ncbi:MAG TPA: peptidoglycan bridge formation glycyltransferase FemA/FemB family protein, partial [Patescibacteria group bacterium]|nr:peptidoglycan bridge formation glycyltransferase FemA/FemB family protein [Patescibacteria group bacterium]
MHLHAEHTLQLDITSSEKELLSHMRKSTRYEIKKAIKQGVRITTSREEKLVEELYSAQIFTAKHQRFTPFSYEYLSKQFSAFSEENHALIYKAEINKIPLAYAFIIFYGKEAVYHYGATTQEGKKYGGAYLIQWRAIQEAQSRGMKWYNFWGVSPDIPSHRFYNLSVFKRGFGGKEIEYLPAHDYVIHYPSYAVNYAIEFIRKKLRNL